MRDLDGQTQLVVEPLRYAAVLRPRWVVLEQVPKTLPIFQATARALERIGYGTWTGTVQAEEYGVPQARRRTLLLAVLGADVGEPVTTHRRYKVGVAQHPPLLAAHVLDAVLDAAEGVSRAA